MVPTTLRVLTVIQLPFHAASTLSEAVHRLVTQLSLFVSVSYTLREELGDHVALFVTSVDTVKVVGALNVVFRRRFGLLKVATRTHLPTIASSRKKDADDF